MTNLIKRKTALKWQTTRWHCEQSQLNFNSTQDVEPIATIIAQDEAIDALKYAAETRAFGQNAYVRGLYGTGRLNTIKSFLNNCKKPQLEVKDRCYVANFSQPDRPRLLTFPAGNAKFFKREMHKFADFITKELNNRLESGEVKQQKQAIEDATKKQILALSQPFEEDLANKNLIMVSYKVENQMQSAIAPMLEDKPVTQEQWQKLIQSGEIDEKQQVQIEENLQIYNRLLQDLNNSIHNIKYDATEKTQELLEQQTRQILHAHTAQLLKKFHTIEVNTYIEEVIEDVIEQFFYSQNKEFFPHQRYSVNIIIANTANKKCPTIIERVPTLTKLLGTIESKWSEKGPELSDHMSITAGTLLRADGGFLIIDARDLLAEAGAWKILIRTIKNNLLEIVPSEMAWPFAQPTLKPDPIAINVRVILLGDAQTYYMLDNYDQDFPELFKVLVDFDTEIKRTVQNYHNYAAVISRLVLEENLLHFDKSAIAALIEHGARICARSNRLTTNFARIADLAREGNFIAYQEKATLVNAEHVNTAIKRTKMRAGLPSQKFQEMLANGTINLFTKGSQIGEINGLAVIHAGPVVYGFPSRITATVAPGRAGIINIEGRADMSGSIHTKGFAILGGLLRHLLPTHHPLTFSASIAFEQSYGGIDGDSASGAEFCCLISAITDLPISQEYAMTGAIDQHGRLQAIGGVNEKIEGFYDTCYAQGLTGTQGVIIPASNAGDLMLRSDVQLAIKDKKFAVYAVEHVTQALAILCNKTVGTLKKGHYTKNSILHKAMLKSNLFWKNTTSRGE